MRGENLIHLKYRGGARILVVDWHTEQNDMIEDVLRREGMVPITCSTSREALDIIDTRPLDAVILEPMMPGIHGYEVLRHIRSRQVTRNLPVIVVSAREDAPFREAGLAMGANYNTTKPYHLRDLVRQVRICVAKTNF